MRQLFLFLKGIYHVNTRFLLVDEVQYIWGMNAPVQFCTWAYKNIQLRLHLVDNVGIVGAAVTVGVVDS